MFCSRLWLFAHPICLDLPCFEHWCFVSAHSSLFPFMSMSTPSSSCLCPLMYNLLPGFKLAIGQCSPIHLLFCMFAICVLSSTVCCFACIVYLMPLFICIDLFATGLCSASNPSSAFCQIMRRRMPATDTLKFIFSFVAV